MVKVRFSHLDDFVLKDDGKVGIGTALPSAKVEVIGTVRAANIKSSSGITTVTSIDGYMNQDMEYSDGVNINTGDSGTLSGEIVVGSALTMSVGTGATTGQGTIESMKVSNTFNPPIGRTNDRPSAPKPGALYYNKDFKTIEYWDGNFWRQVDNTTRRGRGIFTGYKNMEYVNVSSTGNTKDFGEVTNSLYGGAGASNETRGLMMGGWGPAGDDLDIEYITIASEGHSIDFEVDNTGGWGSIGASDSVRAISAGGDYPNATTTIDMFFFSTTGAKHDWGDITAARGRGDHGACSPVRAIFTGGYNPAIYQKYDTKIMATSANTTEFGDIMYGNRGHTAVGDKTRGIITGGYSENNAYVNSYKMEAIQLQSTGVAMDFGEIKAFAGSTNGFRAGVQNMVRGLFAGGAPGTINTIDMITIQTFGSAADFGDLSQGRNQLVGLSDSHGGLGGY